MNYFHKAIALTTLMAVTAAQAQCLTDSEVKIFMANYFSKTAAPNPPASTEEDGACTRAKVNAQLASRMGKVIGYKAGLTNPAVQRRFNYDKPVWGILYDGMVLGDGATVEAAFGAKPLFEADMLVRVNNVAINKATTPMEVLESIDQIIPFIELPDLMVEAIPKLNGPAVSAINVGARLGVAGKPMIVPSQRAERYALLDALRDMNIVVRDAGGNRLGGGRGSDILEHPLNAVVWLAQALAKEGLAMKPGELISLGSFSALLAPKAGLSATVSYEGLDAVTPVSVNFK